MSPHYQQQVWDHWQRANSLEQSVASQHLAILRRAGVVATDRHGKFIYYSLDKDRLAQISRLVEELAN